MTETTDAAPSSEAPASAARKGGGLNAMLLPELKQLAGGLGIKATGLRKGALIEAIRRGFAKLFRRPDPGPVDTAKVIPLTFAVVIVLGGMGLLLAYADIVNPISLIR